MRPSWVLGWHHARLSTATSIHPCLPCMEARSSSTAESLSPPLRRTGASSFIADARCRRRRCWCAPQCRRYKTVYSQAYELMTSARKCLDQATQVLRTASGTRCGWPCGRAGEHGAWPFQGVRPERAPGIRIPAWMRPKCDAPPPPLQLPSFCACRFLLPSCRTLAVVMGNAVWHWQQW